MTAEPPPTGREPLPGSPRPPAAELEAFRREFGRLVDDGEAGRYVAARDGRLHGVWDTFADAVQFAHRQFPDDRVLAQLIDPRMGAGVGPPLRHAGPAKGRLMPALPGQLTATDGGLVRVRFTLGRDDLLARQQAGLVVPTADIPALLDTGAEGTCIAPAVATRLGLTPARYSLVGVPAAGGVGAVPWHAVGMTVLHPSGQPTCHLRVARLSEAEVPLNAAGFDAVVGRVVRPHLLTPPRRGIPS